MHLHDEENDHQTRWIQYIKLASSPRFLSVPLPHTFTIMFRIDNRM